jgi:hypothetical protein
MTSNLDCELRPSLGASPHSRRFFPSTNVQKMKTLPGLLGCLLVLLSAGPLNAQSRALDVEDVVTLLPAPPQVRANIINSRCVGFVLDAAATNRLRSAGADEGVLNLVRGACFTGGELVVASRPSGAEILVNNQRVGTAPWTQRYASGAAVQLSARSGGRTLNSSVRLQPGQRTRVEFGFAADTALLPPVRSVAEVARQLNLAGEWRPVTPEAPRPSRPGNYHDGWMSVGVYLAGAAGGALYCNQEHACGITDAGFPGDENSMEGLNLLAGAVGGLVAGWVVNQVIGLPVNGFRRASYDRAVTRRAQWERSNEQARASWIQSHPRLQSIISEERRKLEEVRASNAAIKQRNAGLQPTRITTEPLPGPTNP